MHDLRELNRSDCSLNVGGYSYEDHGIREVVRNRATGRTVSTRYGKKMDAVEALLAANPTLHDFVQANWGSDSQQYKQWLAGGQRGSKPQLGPGDGRFDAINVAFDLRGGRRCSSMLEALFVTIPSSGRWEDITPERLWPLEECVGFRISPPEEALLRPLVRENVRECREVKAERLSNLLTMARGGRLPREDVPF